MMLAEVGLAWVFAMAATTVGWWAPLMISLAVLAVWPAEGVEFPDPLMRLPRLRSFERALDRVVVWTRRGLAGGGLLLWMDLNDFGEFNHDYGQHVGDEVLTEVGRRIRAEIRTTDFAGRRGGDETAMFFANVVDTQTALEIAGRVDNRIRQPIPTSVGDLNVRASIGGILIRPSAVTPDRPTLTRRADRAMQEPGSRPLLLGLNVGHPADEACRAPTPTARAARHAGSGRRRCRTASTIRAP